MERKALKPVTKDRREQLERLLGIVICPFNIETNGDKPYGIFQRDSETFYRCAADNGTARGGGKKRGNNSAAVTPCPMAYADQCDLFQQYGHLLSIVYRNLGYDMPEKQPES